MQDAAGGSAEAALPEVMYLEDEPVQIDGPANVNSYGNGLPTVIITNAILDPDQIASQHEGTARLMRLMFIADQSPSLRVKALRMAMAYVLDTSNTDLYTIIHHKLTQAVADCPLAEYLDHPESAFPDRDETWINTTAKKASVMLEKLDKELKNFKTNSNKDGIRQGFYNMGHHYLDCGDLQNALRCYYSARDYGTNDQHINTWCMNVIKVNIYLRNWSGVLAYTQRVRFVPQEKGGRNAADKFEAELHIASGLANMGECRYAEAAKQFLTLKFDHCNFPEILSTTCVATYATLCALATFEREDLYRTVIRSASFREFLEMDPNLREILLNFYNSRYNVCLRLLADMKDSLLLDMYLAPHVNPLYKEIRKRAMCQVLYARQVDQWSATFENVLATGREYIRKSQALVLRAAVLKNQIMVTGDEDDHIRRTGPRMDSHRDDHPQ